MVSPMYGPRARSRGVGEVTLKGMANPVAVFNIGGVKA